MITENQYRNWLNFMFDRPISEPQWYWTVDENEFMATKEELVMLMSKMFLQSGIDLAAFSDEQVNDGLWHLFGTSSSNMIFALTDEAVPHKLRTQAIENIKVLYQDYFAKRCAPKLSYIDESGTNPLNSICYILWDITPLSSFNKPVLEVLEFALYLPNDACKESALHGLGHCYSDSPKDVEEIIYKFLSDAKDIRPELIQYAQNAKIGYVQ